MEFSGVYHKTSEQMSYALDEEILMKPEFWAEKKSGSEKERK